MSLINALIMLALTTLIIFGFMQWENRRVERQHMRSTAESLMTLQKAVVRWQVETLDDTHPSRWDPIPTDIEVRRLVEFLPSGSYSSESITLVNTSNPYEFTGYRHGGGETFTLEFSDHEVIIALENPSDWDEPFVQGVQQRLPIVTHPTATEISLRVRHPSSQALMAGTMRRFKTGPGGSQQGMVSPLTFEQSSYERANTPCGQLGAITTAADGTPLVCVEHQPASSPTAYDAVREWEVMLTSGLICRDTRLSNAHPDYNRHAPNMEIVALDSWTQDVTVASSREIRIPSVQLNTTPPSLPICPRGFTLDPVNNDFCLTTATN